MKTTKEFVDYEAFGAIGDGVTDDFEAVFAAHEYANEHSLPIKAKETATYYIGEKFTKSIPVACDVDFSGASFIVDDSVSNAFEFRELPLFFTKRATVRY